MKVNKVYPYLFLVLMMIIILSLSCMNVYAAIQYTSDLCTDTSKAFASSYYSEARTPAKAFDDVTSTYASNAWEAATSSLPQWIAYDFVTAKRIEKYAIYSPNSPALVCTPKSWILQASNNSTNWVDIHTVTSAPSFGTNERREYTFTNNNYYRYYRLYVTEVQGAGNYCVVQELEMMSQASSVSAPANLSASGSNTRVDLTWNSVTGAAGYNVKRATQSGGPYSSIAANLSATTYADTTVINGTTYYYVVSANDSNNTESVYSNEVNVTPNIVVPGIPANLSAVSEDAQVSLTWSASSNASSYNVKRSANTGGLYTTIQNITTTAYTDTTVTNGTTYYYVITAVNSGSESGNSIEVSATPQDIPDTPTSLVATPGNGQVSLSWTAVTGATSYKVKRGTVTGGPYNTVQSSVTVSVYVDQTVTNGTTYFYVISALNAYGESANSTQVSATPQELIINAPTELTATAGNGQVLLAWNAVINATGYNIKKATTQNGPYVRIASNVIETSFIDPSAVNGTTYYYVVSGINDESESGDSNEVSAVPQAPVANYAILKLTMTNGTEKEYDLPINIANSFVSWYDTKSNGTGPAYFVINKNYILGPFASRKEYITFDKVYDFEVEEYVK